MHRRNRIRLTLILLLLTIQAQAQETMSGEDLFKSFGVDPETTEVVSHELAPGMYALRGVGGTIVASIGSQGTLVVDDQFEASVPRIHAAIGELGGGPIDFVINTHWHFDHVDGNLPLAESGTWIVAHETTREMMKHPQTVNLVNVLATQDGYPDAALPVITFSDRLRFHFNGQTIDLLHFGPAHTTSDVAVFFRESGVVHMGDIYNSRYPFIDTDSGGSLSGAIEFCRKVLAELGTDAVIVPGHGVPGTRADFEAYIDMLATVHNRIAALVADGASLEEVIAATPTAEWDEQRGEPGRFIDRAYASMKRD